MGELNQNFEGMRLSLLKKQTAFLQEHIGELNRLNEEVQMEKRTMEAVLNSLTDPLVVVDAGGSVELFNPGAAELLHLLPASHGQPLLGLLQREPFRFRGALMQWLPAW